MNQDSGKMVAIKDDDVPRIQIPTMESLHKKIPSGNPDRDGSPLTAQESAESIVLPGWPTLELYERVQIKGVWFMVTRMKIGSGSIGLRMLTTTEAEAEGRKVIRPKTGDVMAAIEDSKKDG